MKLHRRATRRTATRPPRRLVLAVAMASAMSLFAATSSSTAHAESPPSPSQVAPPAAGGALSFGAAHPVSFDASPDDPVAITATSDGGGLATTTRDGRVHVAGTLVHHGDASHLELSAEIVDLAVTPSGLGWWMVAADGGVFTFGDAGFHGSIPTVLGPGQRLDRPITTLIPTADGGGYWLFAGDGGVFAFGNAPYVGSLPHALGPDALDGDIVAGAAAFDGAGYWLLGRDGGVFAFGDVPFHGSAAPERRDDFVDITASADGYLLLASTGLVRAFGTAHHGDADTAASGIAARSDGAGYWVMPTVFSAASPGQRGAHVSNLQEQLTALGYWAGPVDGSYGHLTSQAVMAFQKWEGLTATGRADAETIDRLRTATRPTPASSTGDLVEIDLQRQLIYVVRGGVAAFTFNTSTGSEQPYEHDGRWFHARTPTGRYEVFFERPIGWRTSHLGRLWRPKYFNGGIAIHGSGYIPAYPDSHGCARLSTAAMDFFYDADLAPVGSQVWVY